MSFPRRLEAELLDNLPADDLGAIRSRRDLTLLNMFMRNAALMSSALRKHAERPPRTLLDLGSGDGILMLNVARQLAPHWRDVTVMLLDQKNIVAKATRESFAKLGWRAEPVSADVFDFLDSARCTSVEVVTANLFLHHFTDEQLTRLFAKVAMFASLAVACEPRRAKFVVELSRLLWAVGCNDVTIHDAIASARAGFSGDDLSALWPERANWKFHEGSGALFSHCFVARRSAAAG